MKKYPKYKSSGVKWIGDVPEHWKMRKLKFVADVVFSNVDKLSFENEIPVELCNYMDVYKNNFIDRSLPFMKATATENEIEKFQLEVGDVLATKDSETPDEIAVPAFVRETNDNLICGYHLALMRSRKEILGEFIFRLLQAKEINAHFETSANGVTRYGLGVDSFKNVFLPIVPLSEQQSIISFLNEKTSQIDRFIANRKKQIELLNEQHTAIINKAVTKGVNQNVKLKPSGIEWLDTIPAHWEKKKLKFVAKVCGRVGFKGYAKTDIVSEGEGALTIGAKHIDKKNMLKLSDPEFISWVKYYESPEIMIELGDVLITQRGSLGKVVLIENDIGPATINPSMLILKKIKINRRFLYLLLTADYILETIAMLNASTAVPMISQFQVDNFSLLIPPPEEQNQIVSFIETESEKISSLITRYEKQIALIQEYRASLIAQAVTGKIDVRDYKVKVYEAPDEEEKLTMAAEK